MKFKFGIPLDNQEGYLDFVKFSVSRQGDFYLVPLPDFLSRTGLHYSFHASGVIHLKTWKPKITIDMPGIADIAKHITDFVSLLKSFFKLPSSGKLLISILPNPERFVSRVTPNRFILNIRTAFDTMVLAAVNDYKDLPYAFEFLRNRGYLKRKESATIINLESGECSVFHPWEITDVKGLHELYPWMPNELLKYKGMITTFDPAKPEEFPFLKTGAFRSWVEPMKEMMERLSDANVVMIKKKKVKSLDKLFTHHGAALNRKKVIQIT